MPIQIPRAGVNQMIKNFFEFLYHFPGQSIIQDVWPKEVHGWLHDHLKAKLDNICKINDCADANAVLRFAGELDAENFRMFSDFIWKSILSKNGNDNTLHVYSIRHKSDTGDHVSNISASSFGNAIAILCEIERCPERAIQSIIRIS